MLSDRRAWIHTAVSRCGRSNDIDHALPACNDASAGGSTRWRSSSGGSAADLGSAGSHSSMECLESLISASNKRHRNQRSVRPTSPTHNLRCRNTRGCSERSSSPSGAVPRAGVGKPASVTTFRNKDLIVDRSCLRLVVKLHATMMASSYVGNASHVIDHLYAGFRHNSLVFSSTGGHQPPLSQHSMHQRHWYVWHPNRVQLRSTGLIAVSKLQPENRRTS
jgi:hypothetical protein